MSNKIEEIRKKHGRMLMFDGQPHSWKFDEYSFLKEILGLAYDAAYFELSGSLNINENKETFINNLFAEKKEGEAN